MTDSRSSRHAEPVDQLARVRSACAGEYLCVLSGAGFRVYRNRDGLADRLVFRTRADRMTQRLADQIVNAVAFDRLYRMD